GRLLLLALATAASQSGSPCSCPVGVKPLMLPERLEVAKKAAAPSAVTITTSHRAFFANQPGPVAVCCDVSGSRFAAMLVTPASFNADRNQMIKTPAIRITRADSAILQFVTRQVMAAMLTRH